MKKIFHNAANSFTLGVASTILLFISNIVYARILGADEYGVYQYISSWAAVLGISTGLGTREYFLRESAVLSISRRKTEIYQLVEWGSVTVFKAYFVTIVVFSIIAWNVNNDYVSSHFYTYIASLPMVLLTALIGIRYAVLRGHNKLVHAIAPESIFKPFFHLVIVLGLWLYYGQITSWIIMAIASLSAGLALIISCNYSNKLITKVSNNSCIPKTHMKKWLRSALSFMCITGLFLLNNQINILMLGSLSSHGEAGIFRVASYGAEFLSFVFLAVNTALAPTIAQLWRNKKKQQLQIIITKSIRLVMLVSFPIAVLLFLSADHLLSLFGLAFLQGEFVMKILCLAQLFNISMGAVGLILNMCNYEYLSAFGVGIALIVNIIANLILIPDWGINGAAISMSISMVFWNIFLLICVKRTTGLKPSIFGL